MKTELTTSQQSTAMGSVAEMRDKVLTSGSDYAALLRASGTPRGIESHRLWLAARVEALLDNYWQARPSAAVLAITTADWIDALDQYTPKEVTEACRRYLSGLDCKRKPKPGQIRSLCAELRPAPPASPAEPERERITPERAAEITNSAGFSAKRFF